MYGGGNNGGVQTSDRNVPMGMGVISAGAFQHGSGARSPGAARASRLCKVTRSTAAPRRRSRGREEDDESPRSGRQPAILDRCELLDELERRVIRLENITRQQSQLIAAQTEQLENHRTSGRALQDKMLSKDTHAQAVDGRVTEMFGKEEF